MFTLYESSPRYCPVTDALVGVTYRAVARVETREAARAFAAQWLAGVYPDDELGLCLRDAKGASVPFVAFDDPAPVPAADDDLPF
jgi:hypothetical protein